MYDIMQKKRRFLRSIGKALSHITIGVAFTYTLMPHNAEQYSEKLKIELQRKPNENREIAAELFWTSYNVLSGEDNMKFANRGYHYTNGMHGFNMRNVKCEVIEKPLEERIRGWIKDADEGMKMR